MRWIGDEASDAAVTFFKDNRLPAIPGPLATPDCPHPPRAPGTFRHTTPGARSLADHVQLRAYLNQPPPSNSPRRLFWCAPQGSGARACGRVRGETRVRNETAALRRDLWHPTFSSCSVAALPS